MKPQRIFAGYVLLGGLITLILLTPVIQSSNADDSIVVVNASKENKVVSFNISTTNDSPPIYGFIITMYGNGHYSTVTKTPEGWAAGIIKYQAVVWTTKTHPIEPGTTEDNFGIEITQTGTHTIAWTVIDSASLPVSFGSISVTIT